MTADRVQVGVDRLRTAADVRELAARLRMVNVPDDAHIFTNGVKVWVELRPNDA